MQVKKKSSAKQVCVDMFPYNVPGSKTSLGQLCIGEKLQQFKNKFQNVETVYFSQNYLIQKELSS